MCSRVRVHVRGCGMAMMLGGVAGQCAFRVRPLFVRAACVCHCRPNGRVRANGCVWIGGRVYGCSRRLTPLRNELRLRALPVNNSSRKLQLQSGRMHSETRAWLKSKTSFCWSQISRTAACPVSHDPTTQQPGVGGSSNGCLADSFAPSGPWDVDAIRASLAESLRR